MDWRIGARETLGRLVRDQAGIDRAGQDGWTVWTAAECEAYLAGQPEARRVLRELKHVFKGRIG